MDKTGEFDIEEQGKSEDLPIWFPGGMALGFHGIGYLVLIKVKAEYWLLFSSREVILNKPFGSYMSDILHIWYLHYVLKQ